MATRSKSSTRAAIANRNGVSTYVAPGCGRQQRRAAVVGLELHGADRCARGDLHPVEQDDARGRLLVPLAHLEHERRRDVGRVGAQVGRAGEQRVVGDGLDGEVVEPLPVSVVRHDRAVEVGVEGEVLRQVLDPAGDHQPRALDVDGDRLPPGRRHLDVGGDGVRRVDRRAPQAVDPRRDGAVRAVVDQVDVGPAGGAQHRVAVGEAELDRSERAVGVDRARPFGGLRDRHLGRQVGGVHDGTEQRDAAVGVAVGQVDVVHDGRRGDGHGALVRRGTRDVGRLDRLGQRSEMCGRPLLVGAGHHLDLGVERDRRAGTQPDPVALADAEIDGRGRRHRGVGQPAAQGVGAVERLAVEEATDHGERGRAGVDAVPGVVLQLHPRVAVRLLTERDERAEQARRAGVAGVVPQVDAVPRQRAGRGVVDDQLDADRKSAVLERHPLDPDRELVQVADRRGDDDVGQQVRVGVHQRGQADQGEVPADQQGAIGPAVLGHHLRCKAPSAHPIASSGIGIAVISGASGGGGGHNSPSLSSIRSRAGAGLVLGPARRGDRHEGSTVGQPAGRTS